MTFIAFLAILFAGALLGANLMLSYIEGREGARRCRTCEKLIGLGGPKMKD
jgi:hypothetical protein